MGLISGWQREHSNIVPLFEEFVIRKIEGDPIIPGVVMLTIEKDDPSFGKDYNQTNRKVLMRVELSVTDLEACGFVKVGEISMKDTKARVLTTLANAINAISKKVRNVTRINAR